jgi:DNA repair exonuclease SbcCD ATPase subunit
MKINHTFKAIVLSFLILVTACKNETAPPNIAELEKLTKENQELKNKLENKDNEVNAFIQSFNEIEGNLEVIKQRENVLKGTTSSIELQKTKQEQIADDINAIGELLAKNKEKIAQLKRKLSKSNSRIVEFEKMIKLLNEQILQKDNDIALLKEELERANSSYKELFIEYIAKVEEVEETKEELKQTNDKLNTAFYAFGTSKELLDKKVITKEGGFIGMGKAEKLRNDFNVDYFTQIDITKIKSLDLKAKRAKLITTHPTGSFSFEMKGKVFDKLIVTDSEKFWSASKYLVVLIE